MTAKRAGRAPLTLARIRLVGFHNFVDETIEIGSGGATCGGHLFLLGDNGSGKTTVLDAIHLALTGGDIELNSAARAGGRRHEGRSLAGIVLRQGPSGVAREGASIAYVALELASTTERHVIGVGLAATTLEAMVTRWGIVHRGTLEDISLTVGASDEIRPRTRDELTTALGPKAVFGRIGDYRSRVAELLFGGDAAYERACRLWSIAKAYRELVIGTRDPGALFERFLPAPSSEVLEAVQRSVHQLGELEASLRGLEAQRRCVAGVASCRTEILAIRRERAELDRYELGLRETELRAGLSALTSERGRARAELARCAAEVADAETRAARADAALATLTNGDAAVWARDLSAAERERDARRNELASTEAMREVAVARRDAAMAARDDARRVLDGAIHEARHEARAAVEDASRLPSLLPHCAAATDASTADGMTAAEVELREALASARSAETEAVVLLRETERAGAERATAGDPDAGPTAALVEALSRSHIQAARLVELLEPRASAEIGHLAALEAVVSKDAWCTVVTGDDDVARARATLQAHPGARLAVPSATTKAALPTWVAELLEPPGGALTERAHTLLAHELTQLGSFEPPDALGGVTLRGALVRASEGVTMLGSERRARLRMQRHRAVETRARDEGAARTRAQAAREAAAVHVERLVRVERAMRALGSPELRAVRSALAERERDVAHTRDATDREEREVLAAAARLRDVEHTIDSLRLLAEGTDRANVVRDIDAASELARRAREQRDAALESRVRWTSRDAELAEHERDARRRLDETLAVRSLAEAGRRAIDVENEGNALTLEEVASMRSELARAERARIDEVFGDGSRGLRGGAAMLGLAFIGSNLDSDLRIEDRAGSPIESVLAELDRALGEARIIVSDRTRELFDVIVIGSLAKQLQRDVEHMHATVTDLNRLLARTELGGVRYAFRVVPRPERAELSALVRRMSALDPASRVELREYLEGRRGELGSKGDEPPVLLDYRSWFDYRLVTRATTAASEETPWTRERRAAGSGGEQGVPNHLIVFALAKLAFDAASARTMPLLLDEAFQGIDASRREGLLAFATELGLQLVVASPDQDGVVASARRTTTLFVVKDEHGDVHLAPYHYWNHIPATQTVLALAHRSIES